MYTPQLRRKPRASLPRAASNTGRSTRPETHGALPRAPKDARRYTRLERQSALSRASKDHTVACRPASRRRHSRALAVSLANARRVKSGCGSPHRRPPGKSGLAAAVRSLAPPCAQSPQLRGSSVRRARSHSRFRAARSVSLRSLRRRQSCAHPRAASAPVARSPRRGFPRVIIPARGSPRLVPQNHRRWRGGPKSKTRGAAAPEARRKFPSQKPLGPRTAAAILAGSRRARAPPR